MRSSESVGVYALRLVNLDSRSSRCHDAVRTRTHSCTPEGKRAGVSSSSLSLSDDPLFSTLAARFSLRLCPVLIRSYAISSPLLFLTFFSPPLHLRPSSFDSRAAAPPVHVYTRACTHARFNPLRDDDERAPLESFDIGDVGKYIRRTDLSDILPPFSMRRGGAEF